MVFGEMEKKQLPDFVLDCSEDLQLAAHAAHAAGEVIRAGYQAAHQIDAKNVGDLVSEVDIAADKAATGILAAQGLAIVSEELFPETDQLDQDMWIVDPLDGTTAYLMKAGPQFSSVLIAKRVKGRTELGVVYFPLTNEWFYGQRGFGAFKDGQPMAMPEIDWQLSRAWVEMNQYGNAACESDFFAAARTALRSPQGAQIVTSTFPHAGVAMRIAEQASGLSAAIHDNGPMHLKQGPWDIAANQVIFELAGGVFVNPEGQSTCPFKAEPIIIAPSMDLAQQIIDCCLAATR